MRRRLGRTAAAAALCIAMLLWCTTAAVADEVGRAKNDAGLGLATVVANIFYVPVKVGYAAVGGVTGGLGYLLTGGNKDVAQKVWVPSIGGDYVLTRDMVSGDQPIEFKGRSDPDM